jgi:predicted metal-dependent peptidase
MNSKKLSAETILEKARIKIVCDAPFFGAVALGLPSELDESVGTAATDGTRIRYAPSFLEKLEVRQVVGLIAHEVLHVALLHSVNRGTRDPELWNQACDYVINLILSDGKYYLPEGGLLDQKYRNLSEYQVYEILAKKKAEKQKQKQKQQKQDDQSSSKQDDKSSSSGAGGDEESDEQSSDGEPDKSCEWGKVEDPTEDGKPLSEAKKAEVSEKILQSVAGAEATARLAGNLPAGIDRLLGSSRKPAVNWRDTLRRLLTEKTNDDWSWRRPSRRHRTAILPSLCSEGAGVLAISVDTSGSISPELYEQAIAEVQECAQSIKARVFIGSCDTKHYGFEEYLDGDPLPKLKGGGGTDFDDASLKLEDLISQGNEVKAHVFITDGEVYNWGAEVVPTVWAIHSNTRNIQPPYGELVNIPREG